MTERSLSLPAIQQMMAQEASDVFLVYAKVTHPDLPEPIRVVNNTESIDFDGFTWIGLPFKPLLPSDREDEIPTVTISIDNVDRELVGLLRGIQSPAQFEMGVIRVDAQGVAHREIGPMNFVLKQVNYDALTVRLSLGYEANVLDEPAMAISFGPSIAPGLF